MYQRLKISVGVRGCVEVRVFAAVIAAARKWPVERRVGRGVDGEGWEVRKGVRRAVAGRGWKFWGWRR